MNLELHRNFIANNPWVLIGDFNVALNIEDSTRGSSGLSIGMTKFKECVQKIEVEDLNQSGLHYTWNQRPHADSCILKKLDRVMINGSFLNMFVNSFAIFKPYRLSDHSPAVLKIPVTNNKKHKPFKFANLVTRKPYFLPLVNSSWQSVIEGYSVYLVVKKLKMIKSVARKLMWKDGNIHNRVVVLRKELDEVQIALDNNPNSKEPPECI